MITKTKGFILIITLLMLAILSALVLYLLKMTAINYQALNSSLQSTQAFYQMERTARQLMTELSTTCVQPEIGPNQALELLHKKQGCTIRIAGQSYHYLIEDLGNFPCLTIKKGSTLLASHHYRLSLSNISLLQLRFVVQGATQACESPESISINEGIVSWRYLNEIKS